SLQDGIGKGSGRSAGNINIYEGLKRRGSLLLSYGGHQYAAGISIREQHIEEFSRLIDEDLKEVSCEEDFVTRTTIDAPCSLTDINYNLLRDLEKLAPFGNQNPEPVLCVKNAQASSQNIVGNNHLRMQIRADGVSYPSIWFGRGHLINAFYGATLDVIFTPQINEWNGSSSIQLVLKDVAIHSKT
ncbi:MAG: DHHA1 domain-containing protein, partial [Syntrophales bacterium]